MGRLTTWYRTSSILFVILLASLAVLAQGGSENCSDKIKYINKNFVDPKPLTLRGISGRSVDMNGVTVPNICVALFAEDDHRFVMQVAADDAGNFEFKGVPNGKYRLVGRVDYDAFCPVNIRIHLKGSGTKKRITLHMRPAAIDDCSYVDIK